MGVRTPSKSHDLLSCWEKEHKNGSDHRQETDGQLSEVRKLNDSSQRGEKKISFLAKQNRKLYKEEQRRNPESIRERERHGLESSPLPREGSD